MVKMATITIADEVEVERELRPQNYLRYNDAVDIFRGDEYPMLKGILLARSTNHPF